VREPVSLAELMDDALRMVGIAAFAPKIVVSRDYAPRVRVVIDRHKCLQVLVNLISNAKHAIQATRSCSGRIVVRVRAEEGNTVRMEVSDDGVGIPQENMVKIFHYGFTTKKDGHGFGLHAAALAAKQMGGMLAPASEGVGRGATFTLVVPVEQVSDVPSVHESRPPVPVDGAA
jgi:signal transduction histidine kinase